MSRAAVFIDPSRLTHRTPAARAAWLACAFGLMACVGPVIAQTPPVPASLPNAGEVVRDLPVEPTMPALPAQAPAEAAVPAPAVPAVSFVLKEFNLKGNTLLTPFQISNVTDRYMGRPMDEKALGDLLAAIRQRYADQGYTLVSVGFPDQDVGKGVLTLQVVEPKVGRLQIQKGADAPVTPERVKGLLSFFDLHEGAPLSTASLERVMFALNDTPGVQARATLSPAGDEGVFNVSIETQSKRWWDASLSLDNHGLRSAGRWRLSGLARLNNPLGIGDNLDVQGLLSNGAAVQVGRLAYELPVMYTPARLSLAYSKVAYDIGGQYAVYEPTGTAQVLETNLTYPLMRSRTRTLMARVGAEVKELKDELFSGLIQGEKRIHALSAGLSFESRDTLLGGGFNGASAVMRWGQMSFRDEASRLMDESDGDLGTGGRFTKAELQFSRLQAIVPRLTAFASVTQQLASRNLDSAEKMTLGGPRGVRAYPTAEGASDEATLLNTELRYWVNPNWTVMALYDWAKGYRSRKVTAANDPDNEIYLRGAGLGVMATYPGWATVRATVAWRGKTPVQTETDNDKMRLFLQAQHSF